MSTSESDSNSTKKAAKARRTSAAQSPHSSPSLAPEPEFMREMQITADKPLLDQLEEFIMGLPDEEFDQASAWLDQNIYRNPQAMSVLTPFVVA